MEDCDQVVSVKIGGAFLHLLLRKDPEGHLVTPRKQPTDFKQELRSLKSNPYSYVVQILGAFYDSVFHEPFWVAEDLQRDLATFLPAATVA